MLELVTPKRIYPTIFDIPLEALYQEGIRGIIIDLDNTLTEWDNPRLSASTVRWIHRARRAGLKVCFVSNNSRRRVGFVAGEAAVPFVAKAQKPRRHSFWKAMEIMDTVRQNTAVIGDQLFTDMLGGNRLGLYTILVSPISRREFIGTRLVRLVEKIILRKINKVDLL